MVAKKKHRGTLFFKLLLFTVYFVFFTVQMVFRFASPLSQQMLGENNFRLRIASNSTTKNQAYTKEDTKKTKQSSYLNKHFQQKQPFIFHTPASNLFYFSSAPSKICLFYNTPLYCSTSSTSFLRGPPVLS
jgi:hypothetical protein